MRLANMYSLSGQEAGREWIIYDVGGARSSVRKPINHEPLVQSETSLLILQISFNAATRLVFVLR